MPIEIKLAPPKDIQGTTLRDVLRAEKQSQVGKAGLSDEKISDLEKKVKLKIEKFKQNTSGLQRRLQQSNDMLEGVVQEVNYPFQNASNVDVKMAIGTVRTLRATMIRAMFSDSKRTFVATVHDDTGKERANKLETAFNWRAAHENGLIDALKESIAPIYRDGTAFLEGHWARRIERVVDYKTYQTADQFREDYPDHEAAKMEEKKYNEILLMLNSEGDGYVDVEFEYDAVLKNDAEFNIIPLARFMWYPLSVEKIEECEIYGVRMSESEATLKQKREAKEYWTEATNYVLSAMKSGSTDQWESSRAFIEGISSEDMDYKRFENYRMVIVMDLDDDDIPEKYLGIFNANSNRFLNIQRYPLRKNTDFIVPLRFISRNGRLLGPSILNDCSDIFQEVSDLHRHRNNSRMISDSPVFIVDENLKDKIDFGSSQFEFRPGLTLWVPKALMDGVRQLQVTNLSSSRNDLDEEGLLVRYVEFVGGPTQGLSGQETREDPNAPATKHLSKLRQATLRIDDYIDEMKSSFPAIGRLVMALYYQYATQKVSFQAEDGRQEIDRGFFGLEGVVWDLNAISVALTPEYDMERLLALRQEAAQNPIVIQSNPMILGILWNRFVVASRISNPEELKINLQQGMPMASTGQPPLPNGRTPTGIGNTVPPLKSLIESLGLQSR